MGPATVGRIGSESRLDYTAVGNTVNLASRLCSCAQDGQILVDPIAAEAIGGRLPVISLGPRSLKGYEGPIEVFAVNERTIVTPIQAQSQHDYIIIPRFSPDPRDKRSEPRPSELAAA